MLSNLGQNDDLFNMDLEGARQKSKEKKNHLEELLKFSNYKYSRDVCIWSCIWKLNSSCTTWISINLWVRWCTHPADQFKALLMPILFYKQKGHFLLEQGTFSWRANRRVHLVYQRYDYEYSCMPVYPFLAEMLIPRQQVWIHIWLWLKINLEAFGVFTVSMLIQCWHLISYVTFSKLENVSKIFNT